MKDSNTIIYDGVKWVKSELVEDLAKRVEELETWKSENFKQLDISCVDEVIENKQEIDFSILNNTDVFWCDIDVNDKFAVFKGNPFNPKHKCLFLDTMNKYGINEGVELCAKNEIMSLRKATEEECELFYKHFPEERPKRKVWIEIYEDKYGDIDFIICNSKSELEIEKQRTIDNGCKTLEIIKREY